MENQEPRKLTVSEIESIVAAIPDIKSADLIAGTSAKESLVRNIILQLSRIKIVPQAIEELKQVIIKKFQKAEAVPGSVVGSIAADGFSAQTIQLNFNVFHSSGSTSNIETGFDRINNLLNASQTVKNPSCTIYFNKDVSLSDVLRDIKPEIVSITVNNLLLDFEIETTDDLMQEIPWWYSIFKKLFKVPEFIKSSKFVLRLHLDKFKMYKHKVTMQQVTKALNAQDTIYAIASPIDEAIVDIYPDEERIREKITKEDVITKEDYSFFFLSTITLPSLDKIEIKGISGIYDIIPETYPIVRAISDEIQQDDGTWILHLNRIQMRVTGLKVERIENLLRILNFKVLPVEEKYRNRYVHIDKFPTSPIKEISRLIEEQRDEVDKELENIRNSGEIIKIVNKVLDAASFVYAITIGSNFLELITHEMIDPYHTTTNSLHEINNTLGIEASRNFLLKEFNFIFDINSAFVSPRHISLIADYMTYTGDFLSVTFSGISKQNIGMLDVATLERSMNVFVNAAMFGKRSKYMGVSSSIFVGSRTKVGTGIVDVLPEVKTSTPENKKEVAATPLTPLIPQRKPITKIVKPETQMPEGPIKAQKSIIPKRLLRTTKIISNVPIVRKEIETIEVNNQVAERIPETDTITPIDTKDLEDLEELEDIEKIPKKTANKVEKSSLKKFLEE